MVGGSHEMLARSQQVSCLGLPVAHGTVTSQRRSRSAYFLISLQIDSNWHYDNMIGMVYGEGGPLL